MQVRQVAVSGGDANAQRTAFEKARRAILRCQPYDMPREKYGQWQSLEVVFNPRTAENLRVRLPGLGFTRLRPVR